MPQHLHSIINASGTRATVIDPEAGQKLAEVRRVTDDGKGFWEATCAQTGALLLPRIAEERSDARPMKRTAWGAPMLKPLVSLGEIIRDLRPVLCA